MSDQVVTLSDSTFEETIATADKPILVDFWAEWCGPCVMLAPVLDEIAKEVGEKLTIAKLNVDQNPKMAQQFNVMSIPTLLVFSGGKQVKQIMGAKGKADLMNDLSEYVS